MPFAEQTKMDARRRLVVRIQRGEQTVSEAAAAAGVSRQTAYRWLRRAERDGLEAMAEVSRRPHRCPRATEAAVVEQVLALKAERPAWGAKKLHAVLWPERDGAPVCARTVARILDRAGLCQRRPAAAAVGRYEREGCNQLWQLDFKGLERRWGYAPLSLLDDCSRYCLALVPLPGQGLEPLWAALWAVWGEVGLPEEVLCDNAGVFHQRESRGPTQFEARLWRLGVRTTHGRPRHPQTQGKVERFHRTLETEWPEALRQPTRAAAEAALAQVRHDYNWVRPHEALGQRPPGSVWVPSPRPRPADLPPAEVPAGVEARRVDAEGRFYWRGVTYRVGPGLAGESVGVLAELAGGPVVTYAGVEFARLDDLRV